MTADHKNANWYQSVTGVVIHHQRVLLARHTYGGGKNQLITPGGYVNYQETPEEALKREYLEETSVMIEPESIIGVRFNLHDWYIAFSARYVSGKAVSDHNENREVLWLDVSEALRREDVPDLTKRLIKSALYFENGLRYAQYNGNGEDGPYSLYSI